MVLAIEWDDAIAWDIRRFMLWTWVRFKWSRDGRGPGRTLQFAQYALMVISRVFCRKGDGRVADVGQAKPYHPIFLDTLATVVGTMGGPVNLRDLGAVSCPN